MALIHVQSKFAGMEGSQADFAPHMEGSHADFVPQMAGGHADFAPHMERRHSFRDHNKLNLQILPILVFFLGGGNVSCDQSFTIISMSSYSSTK